MTVATMTSDFTVPLVIRGELIDEDHVSFDARFGEGSSFRTPNVARHIDRLLMHDPAGLADVQALPLGEIVDYLDALGRALDLESNRHLQQSFELSARASPLPRTILSHNYAHFPTLFSRAVVEETIDHGIGAAYLEGWVPAHLANGTTLSVRAFGARAVHIIAGTGPIVAAMTVMRNAITRGDAIIKMPSNDPVTAAAIARTMIDLDPKHPLTRHVSAAYWRGGDAAIEERLYDPRFIEKLIAWGGSGSMKHITRYLQPGLELIGFDPKWSSTIIGRDAFADDATMRDAAQRMAVDIGAYNQVGCANARVAYIETGTDEAGIARANRFGAMVHEAMQTLPGSISMAPKQFDTALKAELDALAIDRGSFQIIGSPATGIIVVSQYDDPVEFAAQLGDRVGNLVPVDSVEQAVSTITYYTQTIGIFPESLKARLRDIAPLHGAQRLVSLGYACAPPVAGPWDAIEPVRRMCRWIIDQSSDPAVTPPLWQAGTHAGFGA